MANCSKDSGAAVTPILKARCFTLSYLLRGQDLVDLHLPPWRIRESNPILLLAKQPCKTVHTYPPLGDFYQPCGLAGHLLKARGYTQPMSRYQLGILPLTLSPKDSNLNFLFQRQASYR